MSFGLPCGYDNGVVVPTDHGLSVAEAGSARIAIAYPRPQRGPGRPRKDWAARLGISQPRISPPPPPCRPSRALSPVFPSTFSDAVLNVSQAELLHHFCVYTGPSLVATEHRNHPVVQFWQRNAPQLGFSESYMLHMALSLAAHHLRCLRTTRNEKDEWRYGGLAARHLSTGIAEMNKALTVMDRRNCGALLASSILICYCTLAAGPTGPRDLLLCDLSSGDGSGRLLPLIRGMRLIEDSFDMSTLYSALLRPLHPTIAGALDDPRPACVCLGLPRVDWIGPLDRLRKVIALNSSPDAGVYARAFDIVVSVYQAVYGNGTGRVECPTYYKVVLIFLCFAEDQFIACLRRRDTTALLILAHYAPLLDYNPYEWHLRGWAKHIIRNIRENIKGEHAHLMDWPVDITR